MEGHFGTEQTSGMGMGFPIGVGHFRCSRGDVEIVPIFAAESAGGDLRSMGQQYLEDGLSGLGIHTDRFPLSAVTVSISFAPFKFCVVASCPDPQLAKVSHD